VTVGTVVLVLGGLGTLGVVTVGTLTLGVVTVGVLGVLVLGTPVVGVLTVGTADVSTLGSVVVGSVEISVEGSVVLGSVVAGSEVLGVVVVSVGTARVGDDVGWLGVGFEVVVTEAEAETPVLLAARGCPAGATPSPAPGGACVPPPVGPVPDGAGDEGLAAPSVAPTFAAPFAVAAARPGAGEDRCVFAAPSGCVAFAGAEVGLFEGVEIGVAWLSPGQTALWSFVPSGVPTTAIAPSRATAVAVALTAPRPPRTPLTHEIAGPRLNAPSTRRHGVRRRRSSSRRAHLASSSVAIWSNDRPHQSWSTTMLSSGLASRQSLGAQNLSAVRSSQSSSGSGMPPFAIAARARSKVAFTAHSATLREATRAKQYAKTRPAFCSWSSATPVCPTVRMSLVPTPFGWARILAAKSAAR
jgi:hypothetical protein